MRFKVGDWVKSTHKLHHVDWTQYPSEITKHLGGGLYYLINSIRGPHHPGSIHEDWLTLAEESIIDRVIKKYNDEV